MPSVRIFVLAIVAAVLYGQIHDQITAHLCVEYFTIGHPKIIQSTEPARLAIAWGFAATWWVGAILGFGLAIAARTGERRPLNARDLVGPIGILLAVMGACAVGAGMIAWIGAHFGFIRLNDAWADLLTPSQRLWFLVDAWMHGASYLVGFIGGVVLWAHTWRRRRYGV